MHASAHVEILNLNIARSVQQDEVDRQIYCYTWSDPN